MTSRIRFVSGQWQALNDGCNQKRSDKIVARDTNQLVMAVNLEWYASSVVRSCLGLETQDQTKTESRQSSGHAWVIRLVSRQVMLEWYVSSVVRSCLGLETQDQTKTESRQSSGHAWVIRLVSRQVMSWSRNTRPDQDRDTDTKTLSRHFTFLIVFRSAESLRISQASKSNYHVLKYILFIIINLLYLSRKELCRRIGLQTSKRDIFAKLSRLDVCKSSSLLSPFV